MDLSEVRRERDEFSETIAKFRRDIYLIGGGITLVEFAIAAAIFWRGL
jgi:hypothetical protein